MNTNIQDYIDSLTQRMDNLETISVEELKNYVKTVSVKDNIASASAITVLYSGEDGEQMKCLADYASSAVRMLDHTDAYELLTDSDFKDIVDYAIRCDNPGMFMEDIKELRDNVLYAASTTDIESDSFWAIISRRFAAETMGNVYALIPEADPGRIFAKDELMVLMETLPDDATINEKKVLDLKKSPKEDWFGELKTKARIDFANSTVYFDGHGKVVARSFNNTPLANVFSTPIDVNYTFSTNYGRYCEYPNNDKLKEILGADRILDVGESIDDFPDKLHGDDLLKVKEMIYTLEEEISDLDDVVEDIASGEIDISAIVGGMSDTTGNPDWDHYADVYTKYLEGSGKTADNLNSADKLIINILCDHKVNIENSFLTKINNAFDRLCNSDKLNQVFKNLPLEKIGLAVDGMGLVFDIFSMFKDVYSVWPDIENKLAEGDTNEAASILVETVTDAVVTVAAGAAITSVVAPLCMGVGFVIAGPAGAALGMALGGEISNATANLIGNIAGDIAGELTDFFGFVYDYIEYKQTEVLGDENNNVLFGDKKNNYIYGYAGDDELRGNSGDDYMEAGTGDDILNGGIGNDYLNGDAGNDRYVFKIGDGLDTISDYENSVVEGQEDVIEFGSGITEDNIDIQRYRETLLIKYGEDDEILIDSAYKYRDGMGFIESIKFKDGGELTRDDIADKARHLDGTADADIISGFESAVGYNHNEIIKAGAGNDSLYGGSGNDELHGESGIDTLKGEIGDDTYVFNVGDGIDYIYEYEDSETTGRNDKIEFGEGIYSHQVDIQRVGEDLVIKYGQGDQITVDNAYYYRDGKQFVENIIFADGEVLTENDIGNRANQLEGTDEADSISGYLSAVGYNDSETIRAGAGNDYIYGNEGNDKLYGESGNDTLYGGYGNDELNGGIGEDTLRGESGNDTYVFNVGDGIDTIYEYEDSTTEGREDKIVFGEGITLDSVDIQRVGNDLVIKYGEGDQVTVDDAYYGTNGIRFVENIEFADGIILTVEDIANIANQLHGTDESDSISGYANAVGYNENETIRAGAGNDLINGASGDDNLYGESGNDTLYGGSENDELNGGTGNDTLRGEKGNDTYVFNVGDGIDTIYEYEDSDTEGRADKIVFGEGITLDSVDIQRVGNDLVIKYGEGDQVTVDDAYYGTNGIRFVENIEFAEGTVLTVEDIANIANQLHGTDESDSISGYANAVGYNENETIRTGAGNDYIYGGVGEDTLYGESGNDTLRGEKGNDTYVFNVGDGIDTIYEYEDSDTAGRVDKIVFGEGITLDSVDIQRVGNDLVIKYGEGDQVTVDDAYYYSNGISFVENIEFADGTVLTVEDIANIANQLHGTDESDSISGYANAVGYNENETIRTGAGNDMLDGASGEDNLYGESGNDTLYGGSENDELNGGTGNDTLRGEKGNDTYVFNVGDGIDTIYEYEDSDTEGRADKIKFGEGITLDSVDIQRVGNDLVITYGEGDQVTVDDAYYGSDGIRFVENIEFADGTVLTVEDIANIANQLHGTDEVDSISGYANAVGYNENETIRTGAGNDMLDGASGEDNLYGELGNDTLYGGSENDELNGGTGNDTLRGEKGNDTYVFNVGDGIDTIYEYEDSETEGRADKIVFGEGITLANINVQRSGSDFVINYGEGDRVVVSNAYYYSNGISFVENVEFADGTKGTFDYENVCINVTTEVDASEETAVQACVDELQSVYADNNIGDILRTTQSSVVEDEVYAMSASANIDNMVSQLVQDMSEVTQMTVSESTELNNVGSTVDTSQLWD